MARSSRFVLAGQGRAGRPRTVRRERVGGQRMSLDQKRARVFGVLFLITFATSIPALLLYESVLRDPVGYISGAGHDNRILFGALLELLLIIANIGTAVVIYPIVKRQSEELALGYVTARIFECDVHPRRHRLRARDHHVAATGCRCFRRKRRLHPRRDQGLDVPARARLGRRLGERADPRLPDVPLRAGAAEGVLARAHRRTADLRVRDGGHVQREQSRQHAARPARARDRPRVHLGALPRRLLHLQGLSAVVSDSPSRCSRGAYRGCRRAHPPSARPEPRARRASSGSQPPVPGRQSADRRRESSSSASSPWRGRPARPRRGPPSRAARASSAALPDRRQDRSAAGRR